MKAIIIEEKDCKALLDRLELEKYRTTQFRSDPDAPVTKAEVHGWFHYIVTTWLQEQGGLQ